MTIFLRTAFNYDADVASFKSGLDCSVPQDYGLLEKHPSRSRTQQHFKDETDINVMVERFSRTGELPPAPPAPAMADFDGVFDFQSAMNVLVDASRSFDALPAKVRKRFANDPHEMMQFVADEANYDEALKLGLVNPRVPAFEPPVEPAVDPESA